MENWILEMRWLILQIAQIEIEIEKLKWKWKIVEQCEKCKVENWNEIKLEMRESNPQATMAATEQKQELYIQTYDII